MKNGGEICRFFDATAKKLKMENGKLIDKSSINAQNLIKKNIMLLGEQENCEVLFLQFNAALERFKKENVNNYVYVLYAPLSASEFLNHPILNVVLYNNIGKVEYEKQVDKYRTRRLNIKDYEDITTSFDSVFTSVNGYSYNNDDIIDEKTRKIEIKRTYVRH